MRSPARGHETAAARAARGVHHAPVRTCAGCRQTAEATQLWRGVLSPGGHLVMQAGRRKADGRGAYVHPQEKCLIAAVQRGGFDRSFRRKVVLPEIAALLDLMSARNH